MPNTQIQLVDGVHYIEYTFPIIFGDMRRTYDYCLFMVMIETKSIANRYNYKHFNVTVDVYTFDLEHMPHMCVKARLAID